MQFLPKACSSVNAPGMLPKRPAASTRHFAAMKTARERDFGLASQRDSTAAGRMRSAELHQQAAGDFCCRTEGHPARYAEPQPDHWLVKPVQAFRKPSLPY